MKQVIRMSVTSGLLAGSVSGVAFGDFTTTRYTSGTSYELAISHVVDFDQVRTLLPADSTTGIPGANYCVPTSSANLFAYIANHGRPGVTPGAADWEASSNYSAGTSFISGLGGLMLTNRDTGTAMFFAWSAMSNLLGSQAPLSFTVAAEYWSPSNVVSLKEMAKYSINNEAIQIFSYGYYDIKGTNSDGETVIDRDGGHCMTLVGAARSGSTREITYADPADSVGEASQSSFKYPTKYSVWLENLVVSATVSGSTSKPVQSMNHIVLSSSADLTLIDNRLSVAPTFLASWGTFDTSLVASLVLRTTSLTYQPGVLTNIVTPLPVVPTTGALAMSPSGALFCLSNGQLLAEHITASERSMVPVVVPGLDLPSINAIAFCNDRTLVAVSGQQLYAISELDAGLPEPGDNRPVIAWQAQLPFVGAQVVTSYKGQNGTAPHSMLVFSPSLRSIYEVSGDPAVQPTFRTVPAQLPLDVTLLSQTTIVEDRRGGLWFAQKGSSTVSLLNPAGTFSSMTLPVVSLSAFSLDDNDQLLVGDQGVIRAFRLTANGIVEVGIQGSPFVGTRVGDGFTIARSSTNYESRFHSGPGWRNVRPPFPVCVGDFNFDGAINGADLGIMLSKWGTVIPPGGSADSYLDLNQDGLIAGGDLGILLSKWGVCP